jgi:hypothetical protein
VLEADGQVKTPAMRAQVRSVHPPESTRELNQVGVELQIPANIWGISTPPEDWLRVRRANVSTSQMSNGAAPAREPSAPSVTLPPAVGQIGFQPRNAQIASFPAPASSVPNRTEPTNEAAPKRERVIITPDQLLTVVQGRIQQAADKAIQTALAAQLEEAVQKGLRQIAEASKANSQQAEELSTRRLETLVHAAQEEILGRVEARHAEHRSQVAEIAARLEKVAAELRNELAETKNRTEKMSLELVPKSQEGLGESLTRVTEDFEAAAARICDRQIVRMLENKQMVTREVSSQLEARAAEARALVLSASSSALEEFRRQLDVNMDLALSEATQKIMSSLASLDAENRAACEERRRALVTEVARSAEQSADQFRKGIKAFLYSCLVAAVSAVDEHAQSTRQGLVNEPGKPLHEIDGRSENSEKRVKSFWNEPDPQ